MALRVINHYPAINAIDVPKNTAVKVEFSNGIVPSSVAYSTFSVNDAANYTTVPGSLGVEYDTSGNCTTAIFQPYIPLTSFNKYRVYLFQSPNSILSLGNEYLETAYTFDFTVGTGLLINPFPPGIPSGELPTSGTVVISGITYTSQYEDLLLSGFRVISTWPAHQEPNVPTNSGYINILFNADIMTSESDLSGYINVKVTDVLY